MRTFTKIIAPALIAALGFSAVTPAIAQPAAHQARAHQNNQHATQNTNTRLRTEIQSLRSEIDRAAQRRTITQKQASSLRSEASAIQRQYTTYARNGLTSQETRTLENRVNKVKSALTPRNQRGPAR